MKLKKRDFIHKNVIGIFLDTETNGLNSLVHHILELAYKLVDLKTGKVLEQYEAILAVPQDIFEKSDPESLKINGFSWNEISKKGKPIEEVRWDIINTFTHYGIKRKKAVFICQNPSFDRVFFSQLISPEKQEMYLWPYHWLDLASMHWALAIKKGGPLPWETGLSKDAIATHYHLPPENKPHRAMNGVSHLLLCYESVVGFPEK